MKGTARLRRRILSRRGVVSIVGERFEGLPFACSVAEAGFPVVLVDPDEVRIHRLVQGRITESSVDPAAVCGGNHPGRMSFTARHDAIADSDIVIVSAPTQGRENETDRSAVENVCKEVGSYLRAGSLVIIDSAVYPGATEQTLVPLLETSGLTAGRDFLVAYSRSRGDPGSDERGAAPTPRVIGGLTAESAGAAALFCGQIVDETVLVSSCRSAELAHLLEGAFRDVSIGLMNEMAMIAHDMGLDVWEVVEAASNKPFEFTPFSSRPGLESQPLFIDQQSSAWARGEARGNLRILGEAQDVNRHMPAYVCSRIIEALNDTGKPARGASVLMLGVAQGPNVGDSIRHSAAIEVMHLLRRRRAKVHFHDPFVEAISENGSARTRVKLTDRTISQADCVAILTLHEAYDLDWIASHAKLIFDARNVYGARRPANVVPL